MAAPLEYIFKPTRKLGSCGTYGKRNIMQSYFQTIFYWTLTMCQKFHVFFFLSLTMTLWRQCCYYPHCVNKEMEEWEIKVELPPKKKKKSQAVNLSLLCSVAHALVPQHGIQRKSKHCRDIGFNNALGPLGLRGLTLAINSVRESIQNFFSALSLSPPFFFTFPTLNSAQVYVLASSFSTQ